MQKSLCFNCENYIADSACLAFDKIPNEIIIGNNDHSTIQKGQNGKFIFTPLTSSNEEIIEQLTK